LERPNIFELRGNGALVRVFHINNAELLRLKTLAHSYGERLGTAWFDPAFRWKKSVDGIAKKLNCVSEYRGLFADTRSFLEIRRDRKHRKKFLMEELLNTDLLFPLVHSRAFEPICRNPDKTVLTELTCGIGCLARFEVDKVDLSGLELATYDLPFDGRKLVLFTKYQNRELECLKDNFLVRGNGLL